MCQGMISAVEVIPDVIGKAREAHLSATIVSVPVLGGLHPDYQRRLDRRGSARQ